MRNFHPLDLRDLPTPAHLPSCGNQTDVPKNARRHHFRDAGLDVRHMGDGSYQTVRVHICVRCGADRYHKIKETE